MFAMRQTKCAENASRAALPGGKTLLAFHKMILFVQSSMKWKMQSGGSRGGRRRGGIWRGALVGILISGAGVAAAGTAGTPPAGGGTPATDAGGGSGLTPAEARRRIDALRREIAHHDVLYFQKAAPEISDAAYDRLRQEMAGLEARYPDAGGAPAPDPGIGDDRSGLVPVCRHRERMLSLDKAYSEEELQAFLARVARRVGRVDPAFVIEPKFDGLAISVTYEHGRLMRAVSRGNGDEGDDLTANVLTIRSLPRELRPFTADGAANPVPDLIELRGEIYLTFAEFERINREREAADEPAFANPRNFAAGTVRLLDPSEVAERNLSVVFYGWGACEPAAMRPATQRGFHEQVRGWGLPGLEEYRTARGADGVWAAVEDFRRRRQRLPFPVDGAVIKLDSVPLRRDLGETERAPRWALAFKYAPEGVETRVEAITIHVGRTGLLTPVAELAPVMLAGSTVTRAILHNRAMIARQDLRVGDFVYLEKIGEIIPSVSGVDFGRRPAESRPYVFPSICPACGAALAELEDGVAVRCPNPECPAQMRQRLRHFASKGCVKIDGLGPVTIDALVGSGRVKNIADFYRLRRGDLAAPGLERGKSAAGLLAAIERSRHAELWRFIYGLSIPHVGAKTARDLARRFGSLDALAAARREDFDGEPRGASPKPGAAAANAVLVFFSLPQNRAVVADLASLGVRPVVTARAEE